MIPLHCLNLFLESGVSFMVLWMYVHFIGNFDMLDEPEGQTDHLLDGHISGLGTLVSLQNAAKRAVPNQGLRGQN